MKEGGRVLVRVGQFIDTTEEETTPVKKSPFEAIGSRVRSREQRDNASCCHVTRLSCMVTGGRRGDGGHVAPDEVMSHRGERKVGHRKGGATADGGSGLDG